MRELDWPPPLPLSGPVVDLPDLRILPRPAGATLISGDLDAGLAAHAPSAPRIGLGGRIEAPPVLLVIARDRGCLITDEPLAIDSGWDARGFAATPADDAWAFFTLSGARAEAIVAEGCTASLDAGSRSAAVMFAGHLALLARLPDGFLLGVETSLAEALARWLQAAAGGAP